MNKSKQARFFVSFFIFFIASLQGVATSLAAPHVPTATEKSHALYYLPITSLAVDPNANPLQLRSDAIFHIYRQQAMADGNPSPGIVSFAAMRVGTESLQTKWVEQPFLFADSATGTMQLPDNRLDAIRWHVWVMWSTAPDATIDMAVQSKYVTLRTPVSTCGCTTCGDNFYCGEVQVLNSDWKTPAAYMPGDIPVYVLQFDLAPLNFWLGGTWDQIVIAGVAPADDSNMEIYSLTTDNYSSGHHNPVDVDSYAHQPISGFGPGKSLSPGSMAWQRDPTKHLVGVVYNTDPVLP